MSLHDRCNTSYDLASLLRGRHNTLDRWRGKSQHIAKRIGTRPSAFISKEVAGIASSLTLSSSKNDELLQNFVVLEL